MTIGVAILVSGFVSISLTPMLCSRFLKSAHTVRHGRVYNAIESVFDASLRFYDITLGAAIRFRPITMAVSLALLVATGYLFTIVPKGFLPSEDQGRFGISTEAIQGITFPDMVRHQLEATEIVSKDPAVGGWTSNVGQGGGGGSLNTGRINIDLKPRDQRDVSVDQVIARLRPQLAQIAGLRTYLTNQPPINLGGQGGARSLYQFTLQDTDTEELYEAAGKLETRMRDLPQLEDVSSDLQLKNPQIMVSIDRDKLGPLGLTANQVETALYNSYGTRQVTQIYAPNNQYQVILQVAPEFQKDPSALRQLYVNSSSGRLVPLDTVAKVITSTGPLAVSHTGQLPSVTISFNLKQGVALGDAVDAVQAVAGEMLPSTVATRFQGTAQAFQESLQGLGIILLMAIVVIYIVLGVLYESFTHPLTILSGLPAAGFGGAADAADLQDGSGVACTPLSWRHHARGAGQEERHHDGRLRGGGAKAHPWALASGGNFARGLPRAVPDPIMMTTMAALVGTLPIALGLGAGAESRRPLGLAVVGGLVVSQLLTLYITPVYYIYIEGARLRLFSRREQPAAPPAEATAGLRHGEQRA